MLVAFGALFEASDDNKHTFTVQMASGLACEDARSGGRTRTCCRRDTEATQCGERGNSSECESGAAKHGLHLRTRTHIRVRTICLRSRLRTHARERYSRNSHKVMMPVAPSGHELVAHGRGVGAGGVCVTGCGHSVDLGLGWCPVAPLVQQSMPFLRASDKGLIFGPESNRRLVLMLRVCTS